MAPALNGLGGLLAVAIFPECPPSSLTGIGHLFSATSLHFPWAGLVGLVGCLGFVQAGPDRVLVALGYFIGGALLPALPFLAPELWGAPLHVGAALFAGLWVQFGLWAARRRLGRAPAPHGLALGLLGLGLLWNHSQGLLGPGWVWDWIEAAPVCLGAGPLLAAHAWARRPSASFLILFAAALQLGRGALTLSLHHTQPPVVDYVRPALGRGAAEWVTSFSCAAGLLACCMGARHATCAVAPPVLGPLVNPPQPPFLQAHARLAGVPLLLSLAPWASGLFGALVVYWGGLVSPRRRGYRTLMQSLQRGLTFAGSWMRGLSTPAAVQGLLWGAARINRHTLSTVLRYAAQIVVPPFRPTSVFGFALLVGIYVQMYSGLLLALYYLPDPTFTMAVREDLFLEVWWFLYVYKAHVIGVDLIFVLSYLHVLKKFYLRNYAEGDLDGWFTGAYAFLVYHLVVFLGITLSTNHLGDVTIMIAANIYWSLFFRWHKVYAPFFTNKHLSVDQLTRFMVAHYLSAWYYTYLVQTHVLFVHEMWDADADRSTQLTTSSPKASWLWDALKKEGLMMITLYLGLGALLFLMAHPDSRVVNYSFFEQWSEAEVEEINFFIVAPHWYFRPHMGLLTVCAHHYEGLAWFVAFYLLLCYTPHVHRFWGRTAGAAAMVPESAPLQQSAIQEVFYFGFVASILYVGGTLPCGRFYYENVDGFFGNFFLRLSYEYIYLYMGLFAHLVDRLERALCLGAAWQGTLANVQAPSSAGAGEGGAELAPAEPSVNLSAPRVEETSEGGLSTPQPTPGMPHPEPETEAPAPVVQPWWHPLVEQLCLGAAWLGAIVSRRMPRVAAFAVALASPTSWHRAELFLRDNPHPLTWSGAPLEVRVQLGVLLLLCLVWLFFRLA